MAECPAIGAIAPWYGAKRNLAPAIVEALGPHRAYWEPFCGSMAVLLAKPRATMETVSDLHGDLTNLAWMIVDPRLGPALYRRLRRTLFCEAFFADSLARMHATPDFVGDANWPDAERAYWFFVHSWMGRNGLVGTRGYNHCTPCLRYSQGGGHSATRWAAAVRSIPQWRERLRRVNILCRDGFELLERIADEPGCAIYVDPPYLSKSALYEHDFTAAQHSELAETVSRFRRARIVVSYYDHPQLAELYPAAHWHWRKIEVAKAMSHVGGNVEKRGEGGRATEVLLTNRASQRGDRAPATLFD